MSSDVKVLFVLFIIKCLTDIGFACIKEKRISDLHIEVMELKLELKKQ